MESALPDYCRSNFNSRVSQSGADPGTAPARSCNWQPLLSHPARMSFCTIAELDEEWKRSAIMLTEIIGEQIRIASVPGGYYSPRVASSAARAGIELLFNSEPVVRPRSIDGCLVLGRFTVQRGDSPKKSAAISAGARQPQIQQYLFWNCKKVLKVLGGTVWLRARIFLLATQCPDFFEAGVGL